MKIIIDAMGGDNAPKAIVEGALAAHTQTGAEIVLVGQENGRPAAGGCRDRKCH